MKIERGPYGYYVSAEHNNREGVSRAVVHALIRLGMEKQRDRDAALCDSFMMQSTAKTIRKEPISQADIEAAIGATDR